MNDSDYSEFDMSENTQRDFDIVVYGATGFTGALVTEYLHENQTELSWAVAGRSQTKLDDLKRTLNAPDLATLVADSSSADDIYRRTPVDGFDFRKSECDGRGNGCTPGPLLWIRQHTVRSWGLRCPTNHDE